MTGGGASAMLPAMPDPSFFEITPNDFKFLRPSDLQDRLRGAVLLEPRQARHHRKLAVALSMAGQQENAIRCLRRSTILNVAGPKAYQGLARLYAGLGRAADASRALRRAICLVPGAPDTLESWARALVHRAGQEAIQTAYHRLIAAAPDRADAWIGRGLALGVLRRTREAQRCFTTAIDRRPDDPALHSSVITAFDHLLDRGTAEVQADRRQWARRHASPLLPAAPDHRNDRNPDRRLRVGYISADFRGHSATTVFAPVVLGHDPRVVELVLYSNGSREDAVTERFKARADLWRPTTALDDSALAHRIKRDRVDILVDLSGHSEGNRLLVFARKPAPVQVTAWGYALTTGLPAIDYFLTDPIGVPAAARSYLAETCVDLPCMIPFDPPRDAPPVTGSPAGRDGRITFGSFNRWSKTSGPLLECWARILTAVENSRLLIKTPSFDDGRSRNAVIDEFAGLGIPAERLDLRARSSRHDHLAACGEVDIALDSFPHAGGVTTWETLFMGVPVVSKAGDGLAQRLTATILHAVGAADWIAKDAAGYEALAISAARTPDRLAAERHQWRARVLASPGCDAAGYTRAVETEYRAMWRRWCASPDGAVSIGPLVPSCDE